MTTPTHTLLLITNSRLARIDFVGRRSPRVGEIQLETRSNSTLSAAVAQSLALLPNRPGPVSILATDVWSEVLYLEKDIVSIATNAERNQALALDAEAESGISAFDSLVASVRLETKDRDEVPFGVIQIANAQIGELNKLVRSFHSKLFCITHPILIDIAGHDSAKADQIIDGLLHWNDDSKCSLADGDAEKEAIHIANAWAELLGRQLDTSHVASSEPLWIKPIQPSISNRQWILLAASIAALTTFGCFQLNLRGHFYLDSIKDSIIRIERQQNDRTANLDAIKKAELRLNQLRKDFAEAESTRETNERQVQLATHYQARQSQRWTALLDGLAESAEDCWVKEIKFDSGRTIVHGFAPSNASAHSFAGRIERRLHEGGWVVTPAATSLSANGLVEFFVTLAADKTDLQHGENGKQVVTASLYDRNVDLATIENRGGQP